MVGSVTVGVVTRIVVAVELDVGQIVEGGINKGCDVDASVVTTTDTM